MTFPRTSNSNANPSFLRRHPLVLVWVTIVAMVVFSVWLRFWTARHRPHSPLQAAVWQLKPAMDRDQVDVLFRAFAEHESEFNGGRPGTNDLQDPPVFFQFPLPAGRTISYSPTGGGFFSIFESCDVYFDTNGVISGYHYSYDR